MYVKSVHKYLSVGKTLRVRHITGKIQPQSWLRPYVICNNVSYVNWFIVQFGTHFTYALVTLHEIHQSYLRSSKIP